jgi:toxin YhaV
VEPINSNGWDIYFHPLFNAQIEKEFQKVENLKNNPKVKKLSKHPTFKLFKSVLSGIEKHIPKDPFCDDFVLTGDLEGFGRLKGKGLDERYRLFFKAFADKNLIFITWLGYPRKEGDKNDCYRVFKKKVNSGELPTSLDAFLSDCGLKEP